MRIIAFSALISVLVTSAWAAEPAPASTLLPPSEPVAAATPLVLNDAEMDQLSAGAQPGTHLDIARLQVSLFGGPIFVAPQGCGGFSAEFGC